MKIAFDAQSLFEQQKTGIGRCAEMLVNALVECPDFTFILNCFRLPRTEECQKVLQKYEEKGCLINRTDRISSRVYNHLERLIPLPYRKYFGDEADITQFFNYTVPYGVAGKSVTIVHDMTYLAHPETVQKRTRRWLNRNLSKYCERASVVLTVSEFSKGEIEKYLGIPAEKIEVVPDGVDRDLFHPGYPEEEIMDLKKKYGIAGDYILYLGTLEPRKNIETLVAAYAALKEKMPDAPKLLLAGKKGWMYDSIFKMVTDRNLTGDVIFCGYVPEEEVPLFMSGAKMFVFPSLYEGFGMPPLEAMACGTPVLTSNAASLPEVVGEAGILVPAKDAEAFTGAMERLLSDSALRERLSKAGPERAAHFTWEAAARKLIGIYHTL